MNPEEFRRAGHQLIDWIADYRARVDQFPVRSALEPGVVRAGLPKTPSAQPEPFEGIFSDLEPMLSSSELELLKKNAKAVFYEPLVGASAHALATTCDRVRYGTLPPSVAADAMVQQAANLAVNLAAQIHRWAEFRSRLRPYADGDVKPLVLAAVALGWSEKWRQS